MAWFEITDDKTGKVSKVEAATMEEAMQKANAAPQEQTSADKMQRGRSLVATGLRNAGEGAVGILGDLPGMTGGATTWLAKKFGVEEEEAKRRGEGLTKTMEDLSPLQHIAQMLVKAGVISPENAEYIRAPTSEDVHGVVSSVLPERLEKHTTASEPQNNYEKAALLTGNFLPALINPSSAIKSGGKLADEVLGGASTVASRVAAPVAGQLGAEAVSDKLVDSGWIDDDTAQAIQVLTGAATGMGGGTIERALSKRQAANTVNASRPAMRRVYEALQADGLGPDEALTEMKKMGIDATLMDLGPNLKQEGIRTVANSGEGKNIITSALESREKAAGDRAFAAKHAAFGEAPNRDVEMERFDKRLKTVGSGYDDAKRNQQRPADLQSIADDLDAELATARGSMRGPLEAVRKSLDIPGAAGNLDPSAEGLHAMRQAIDQQIADAAPGSPIYAKLNKYRQRVDAELKGAAPDVKQLDTRYSAIKDEQRAFESGEAALKKTGEGGIVASPDEFSTTFNKLNPREKEKALSGASRWLEQQIGLTDRERQKLKTALGGDWNEAKMRTMIGDEKTDAFMAGMEREDTFRDTYNRVVHNSKTAEALEPGGGRSLMENVPQNALAGTAGGGVKGAAVAGGMTFAQNLLRKFTDRGVKPEVRSEVARLLTTKDPEKFFAAVKEFEAAAGQSAIPQSIIQAILANQYEPQVGRR